MAKTQIQIYTVGKLADLFSVHPHPTDFFWTFDNTVQIVWMDKIIQR